MADHPTDQPSREGDSERFALGKNCEYGCGGPCRDLGHWADRASYLHLVSNEQMDRAETAETAASTLQAAEAERDKLSTAILDHYLEADREGIVHHCGERMCEANMRLYGITGMVEPGPYEGVKHTDIRSVELRAEAAEAREDALRETVGALLALVSRSDQHDTGCPLSVMHDDFYENPADDEHPVYPRACDCHVEPVRKARSLLSTQHETNA